MLGCTAEDQYGFRAGTCRRELGHRRGCATAVSLAAKNQRHVCLEPLSKKLPNNIPSERGDHGMEESKAPINGVYYQARGKPMATGPFGLSGWEWMLWSVGAWVVCAIAGSITSEKHNWFSMLVVFMSGVTGVITGGLSLIHI